MIHLLGIGVLKRIFLKINDAIPDGLLFFVILATIIFLALLVYELFEKPVSKFLIAKFKL